MNNVVFFTRGFGVGVWIVVLFGSLAYSETMTFETGASHSGFTFTNWEWDSGSKTIFSANQADPSIVSKNSGMFDLVSIDVAIWCGGWG